ncbi:glycosyltransferase involved in cell wall biosynthesis [Azospirillum lipoferum]|uniref:Glycosyltransferase family 4 protein n=1 Tax=Azospirillum lipoferum TaxID=193 RepID=A0A5A9GIP5_AZOLI|nr:MULTISPECIES: glycosyltransferase family 4 protein [Azospirillum]KAA0593715.1 glycosyltransferase family 4 protein [Azospirillum lipoferum]MCP1615024.1 glycosyltransferase involved in cell wall biosynthesis [Azospirillum lipoferum]MDW5536929.1 glycosyltransferase family 4 protein [Azospirillum sp. NL1]
MNAISPIRAEIGTIATYQGRLEFVTTGKIYGWLHNQSNPAEECLIDLYVDGRFLGTHACNEHHKALSGLPGRNGFLAFNIPLPAGLLSIDGCCVDIKIHGTRMSIPGAPVITGLHRAVIDTALSGMTPERQALCASALSETTNQTKRGRDRGEDARLLRPAKGFEGSELTVGGFLAHQLYRLQEQHNFHLRSAADLTRFLVRHAERFTLADHAWCPLPADVKAYLASGEEDATGFFRSRLLSAYRTGVGDAVDNRLGSGEDALCDLAHWMFGKARLPKEALSPRHVEELNTSARIDRHGLISHFYAGMHARDPELAAAFDLREERALFPLLLAISLWLVRWNLDDLFLPPEVRALLDAPIHHDGQVMTGLGYFYTRLGVPGAQVLSLSSLRQRQSAPVARHLPRTPQAKGVNLFGYFDGGTGISRNALFSRDILQDAGFGVTMPMMAVPNRHAGEELYPINLIHFGLLGAPGDMINHGLARFAGAYNIGFFLWETSALPRSAHLALEMMDEVWTMSAFCADTLGQHFSGPIHIVPNCVDERVLKADTAKRPEEQPFTFYFCFDARSWYTRKNPLAVARAFQKAFPAEKEVRLVLRIRYRQTSRSIADLAHKLELDRLIESDPRILVRDRELSYADSLAEMRSCDAYVSLHRAEGFGYTMVEAMMMGKPVIASRYSANLDYMSDETGFLVGGCERYLDSDEYIGATPGARWFEPDIGDAAEAMRQVWEDRGETQRRAAAGAALVRSRFARPVLQELYASRLSTILQNI